MQVTSLLLGMYNIKKQLQQSVNRTTTTKLLNQCKKHAIIFFTIMILLVIVIDPLSISKKTYDVNSGGVDDDYRIKYGVQTYARYAFFQLTTNLFYNLSITCYLSIVMLFISLTLSQVKLMQNDTIISIDDDKLTCDQYMITKDKILYLQSESYLATQILTISAGINVLTFVFTVWLFHYNYKHYQNTLFTYKEMLFLDFDEVPYLLKGKLIIIIIITIPYYTIITITLLSSSSSLSDRDSVLLLYPVASSINQYTSR